MPRRIYVGKAAERLLRARRRHRAELAKASTPLGVWVAKRAFKLRRWWIFRRARI